MQKFAFLRTWPYSKHILDKGHVLRNANFCIQRQIKNFTRNDLPNLLLVCTTTYVYQSIKLLKHTLDNQETLKNTMKNKK